MRKPLAIHDPGKVETDLALTLPVGGDCMAGIALLRAEPARVHLTDTAAAAGQDPHSTLRWLLPIEFETQNKIVVFAYAKGPRNQTRGSQRLRTRRGGSAA